MTGGIHRRPGGRCRARSSGLGTGTGQHRATVELGQPGAPHRSHRRVLAGHQLQTLERAGVVEDVEVIADDDAGADPLRVLFLTGARPCELVNGIEVQITDERRLGFIIQGGKVTAQTGQPQRVIEVEIDNEVAEALAKRVAAGSMLVCIVCPRKLSDKVRGMSRRLFPKIGYVISPYTFRHAIAAREKACGRSVRL